MRQTLWSSMGGYNLKTLWYVLPFINKVPAMPVDAHEIILFPLLSMELIKVLNKNVFPVPPGPSRKNNFRCDLALVI